MAGGCTRRAARRGAVCLAALAVVAWLVFIPMGLFEQRDADAAERQAAAVQADAAQRPEHAHGELGIFRIDHDGDFDLRR